MKNKSEIFISSTVDYHNIFGAVKTANRLQTGLEISRFGKLREIDDDFDGTLAMYKDAISGLEGPLTLHGFFSNLCLCSKDPLIKEASVKRYYQSFEIAAELGAKTVVFHTCYNNLLKQKQYRENFFLSSLEFFREFIPHFEAEGIVATIENVHEPDNELIRNIIAAINSPNLKATIDIGHCNIHSKIPVPDWIKDYGIMLHHMHFHNNFKDEDAHGSLKNGSLEIKPILETLKDMQLFPQIAFEIFDIDALEESLEYFRQLEKEVYEQ